MVKLFHLPSHRGQLWEKIICSARSIFFFKSWPQSVLLNYPGKQQQITKSCLLLKTYTLNVSVENGGCVGDQCTLRLAPSLQACMHETLQKIRVQSNRKRLSIIDRILEKSYNYFCWAAAKNSNTHYVVFSQDYAILNKCGTKEATTGSKFGSSRSMS